MQVMLPLAQSGGSEASARSHPPILRRSIKAAEPKVREHKEAAVRARNARNQHLHRQRQKVSMQVHALCSAEVGWFQSTSLRLAVIAVLYLHGTTRSLASGATLVRCVAHA